MRNFLKIFLLCFFAIFLFSSCGEKKDEISEGGTGKVQKEVINNIENKVSKDVEKTKENLEKDSEKNIDFGKIPGENAKFVVNFNFGNTKFLIKEIKEIIPNYIIANNNDLPKNFDLFLNKFGDSNLTISSLSTFENNSGEDISDIEVPTAVVFSNIDTELLSFIKDFKKGVLSEDFNKTDISEEDLEKIKDINEILKKGVDLGKFTRKSLEKEGGEEKEKSLKMLENMKIENDAISFSFAEENEEKLTGMLKDNALFNKLFKNLSGDELLYVFVSGEEEIKKLGQNESFENLNFESMLVGLSLNKTGIYFDIYSELKENIPEVELKTFDEQAKKMEQELKQNLQMYSGFLLSSLEDEEDINFVKSLVNGIKVEVEKISENSFSVKISLEADMEKVFDILKKMIEKSKSSFDNETSTGELED